MKFSREKTKKIFLSVLFSSMLGLILLSWILVFRDERALAGFESVYPFLDEFLFAIRELLLQYSLNVIPTLLFAIFGITAFFSYIKLLKFPFNKKQVIKIALILQVVTFFSYPVLSTDIFSYVFSNRVATEYQQNKWLVAPQEFSDDVFEQFADWKDKTNVYGYVNHVLYLPANYFGFDDVFTTILLYKLTAFGFFSSKLIFSKQDVRNSEAITSKLLLKVNFLESIILIRDTRFRS